MSRGAAGGDRAPVLLVSAAGVLGGAERVLLEWTRGLEPPVLLACPPGPLAAAAVAAGIDVEPLPDRPLQRRGRSGRTALELAALGRDVARLTRRQRPAVIVASGQRPLIAAASAPPRALILGALVPWKRADLALEIAARLPDLHLDVAGAAMPGDRPEFAAALRERTERPDLADRVRLLGALDDPRPAMAQAHALLHCADREPFGLALVEALAAGRPVVAPASAGPLEIVTPACGRLYAPRDADAGAVALRDVLMDPAAPAAARARAAAFDGAAAARRFAAVLERLH
jgi:glycosyltransferase involved in cell wall biosynthesis